MAIIVVIGLSIHNAKMRYVNFTKNPKKSVSHKVLESKLRPLKLLGNILGILTLLSLVFFMATATLLKTNVGEVLARMSISASLLFGLLFSIITLALYLSVSKK
ncbi:MAG TPA: hypothetical protein PKK96_16025 [Anaerolineales bacterium]|nr:hypothetical protein [Anaerolineales bacterium]HNQ94744.1 hypothetical protein [Anaerolineales bacterium]HNS62506.1 hypothetical protein [Anaerolineales bacterium]